MRGTGKSFIGNLAARTLSLTSLDAFEEKHKIGVREFVHENGWPEFRDAELVVLKDLIETKERRHLICLGGHCRGRRCNNVVEALLLDQRSGRRHHLPT